MIKYSITVFKLYDQINIYISLNMTDCFNRVYYGNSTRHDNINVSFKLSGNHETFPVKHFH